MPGGSKEAYEKIEKLLLKMSADDGEGGKCVSYLGDGGAGHFVKMVHNGIEYSVMQLIAEVYAVLKNIGGFSNEKLGDVFMNWSNDDEISSYLLEITAEIFTKKDENGDFLIDAIKDKAGQKGTGKWTTQAAFEYGVAIPIINAAVDARILSGSEEKRKIHSVLPKVIDDFEDIPPEERLISMARNALKLSVIAAYGQGFDLLQKASNENKWNLNLSEIARIWRGGCIIRSVILSIFQKQYGKDLKIANAEWEKTIQIFSGDTQRDWRRFISIAIGRGVAVPALSASITSFDSIRAKRLPQNLIQAQRDFFGAHGYERIDKEGDFHTEWGN
jgi:6-phosphogluconate dehydrogenase